MATKRGLNNTRKLIDKTPIVDVNVFHKSPIPASRGVDTFHEQSTKQINNEFTYKMKQIIDNEGGPTVTDPNGTIFNHTAKIWFLVDEEDTEKEMILKVNGIFD